jgi:hypothetical protein
MGTFRMVRVGIQTQADVGVDFPLNRLGSTGCMLYLATVTTYWGSFRYGGFAGSAFI